MTQTATIAPVEKTDDQHTVIDLTELSRVNGISEDMILASLSWDRPDEGPTEMKLAHDFKRATGFNRQALLIALMGRYIHRR